MLARLLPPRLRFRVCGVPDDMPGDAAVPDVQTVPHGTGSHIGGHLDTQDRLMQEGSLKSAEPLRERFILRQRFFPPVREVPGTAWSLATVSATNYFHWMFECLPRLRFLREANTPYDWIYACHNQRFQREAFAHLGLPEDRIIDSATTPFLRAEQLIVPRRVDKFEPWIVPWLRETLLPLGESASGATLPKRIYISRRKASSRGVANDAELTALLDSHGFTEVRLEEHSLAGQIALFRQAEAIVAPHGAGLTNLVFSEPGTLVVELIALGYGSDLYARLGQARQLNYHLVECPAQDPARVHASAVLVDVLHVRTILGSLHGAEKK
ncbi:MAG TPA: glycosyltransferase family 61 protein [Candidatus Methylacidiphilales bacterium]|nr:glycosyltransferase family 61 protein [Candidatus Methylacidiphilales bacterium]